MLKADRLDKLREAREPRARSLPEAVEGSSKFTHSSWACRIGESRGLLAVHAFLEVAVEKRIGDVKLVRWPLLGSNDGKHRADGGGLDDRRERFPEVDAGPLVEPANDPPRLVAFQRAVGAQLVLEHPFAGDDACSRRSVDEGPDAIAQQGIELGLHCCTPVRVTQGGVDGLRDW